MKTALAFSGGKDSMVCLHLWRDRLDCAIYVDTGFAYPETQRLVEYAMGLIPMHIVRSDRHGQNERQGIPSDIVPLDWTVLGQQVTGKKAVTIQSYLGCCWENIAAPILWKAKQLGVTHLVYGQRNSETHKAPSRNGDVVDGIVRLHPIEDWSDQDVLDYLTTKMDVPPHYTIKHSSLDCYDCPAYTSESKDRLQWTKAHYPEFYTAYAVRLAAIDGALLEALNGSVEHAESL